MILTANQLISYARCGEFDRLTRIEGVASQPTTRQIGGRAVRAAIQRDLAHKLSTGALLPTQESRHALGKILADMLAGEVALTPQEAAQGNRRIYEQALLNATRMYMLWRSTAAQRIDPSALNRSFVLNFGSHQITGFIEIQTGGNFRATKVRSRRPEDGEASRDLSLAIQSLALDGAPATVDYLVNTKDFAYVRQEVDFGPILPAAENRIRAYLRAMESEISSPVPEEVWWCRNCSLRSICRYVP